MVQTIFIQMRRLKYPKNNIIIEPNFQRNNVWDTKQKSELIESVLMGIPIPIMYFFKRNALYQGKATELLNRLVELDCFKQATDNAINSTRMKDKYFVLRFLSFYLLYENWLDNIEYKSDIDDFLAKTMTFINKLNDNSLKILKDIFQTAMQNSYNFLGENRFRFATGKSTKPITIALFEIMAYLFSDKDIGNLDKDLVKKEVEHLKSEFEQSGTFLNRIDRSANVEYRFNKIKELRDKLLS